MLHLINSIIGCKFYKKFGFPKVLPSILTFSINDCCNSRCKTCNIWKNNPKKKMKEQLNIDEIKKIFSNFKRLYWITITGGEPFMRNDLDEVIKAIYDESKPKLITIATNGMATQRIVSWTKEILGYCKNLDLVINISLDGIGEQHDKIRGVKGNFDLAIKTLIKLKKLNHPRLTVGVNTVISRYNVAEFPKIYTYIKNNFNPDDYIAEIAENRAKLGNMKLKITPDKKKYLKALLFLINSLENEKQKKKISKIVRTLRIEFYKYLMQQYPLENFEGIASAYIMFNGEVWVSYSKRFIVGNLREVNYDFGKLWFNEKANEFRMIMEKKYSTMLANAFYVNFIYNPKNVFKLFIS